MLQCRELPEVFEVGPGHKDRQRRLDLVADIKLALTKKSLDVCLHSKLIYFERTLRIAWSFYRYVGGLSMLLQLLRSGELSTAHITLTFSPTEQMLLQPGYHAPLRIALEPQKTGCSIDHFRSVSLRKDHSQIRMKKKPKYRQNFQDEPEDEAQSQKQEVSKPTSKQAYIHFMDPAAPLHDYKLQHLNRMTSSSSRDSFMS